MASKLRSISTSLTVTRSRGFDKIFKFLSVTPKNCFVQLFLSNQSCEQNGRKETKSDCRAMMLTVLTAFGLLLYGFREKFKIDHPFFPTVVGKDKISLRKRFNFVADVVDNCASAVVCIQSQAPGFGKKNIIPRGSGFIVKEDGLIVTNAHMVINKPSSFQVKLKDGEIYSGHIEDIDLNVDLATIRINKKNLPVMKLGSSDDLRAGEWVIAIGSPFSLMNSVCVGVVSSPQRKGEDLGLHIKDMHYIQTDASITFGSSGSPLINLDGEVVGVNSMKAAAGISFAIPIDYVKKFLESNEERRKREGPNFSASSVKRGYMGIQILTLTQDIIQKLNHQRHQLPDFLVNKVLIFDVTYNTPAYRSGLRPGDVIAEVNGKEVEGVKTVFDALERETSIRMKIIRDNIFFYVTITPERV